MNPPKIDLRLNFWIGAANIAAGALAAWDLQLGVALFCGAAGAFNLAIWRTVKNT